MKTKEIQLSRKITTQLLHLAQISPEHEVCGLIGRKNGFANTCYPIKNKAAHSKTRYQLDEKQQINAMSTMRDNDETLFAIYHSHPTTPAIPSSTDIKLAAYPDTIQLIISLNTKGVLEIRAYNFFEDSFEEITLSLLSH